MKTWLNKKAYVTKKNEKKTNGGRDFCLEIGTYLIVNWTEAECTLYQLYVYDNIE